LPAFWATMVTGLKNRVLNNKQRDIDRIILVDLK
jgi:hypothetical protein